MTQPKRRIQIVDADIVPRTRGAAHTVYRVPLSRRGLGDFLAKMMWKRGFFVTVSRLATRRSKAGLPMLDPSLTHRTYVDPETGKRFRGVWAWRRLAYRADTAESTLQTLVNGEHKRTPGLLTVLKVFRALGLEWQAADIKDTNVDLIVKGW